MKHIWAISLFTLFFVSFGNLYANDSVISDERVSEISQRLEGYSTESLIERREFLVSYQDTQVDVDEDGIPVGTSAERALEISIIDALLVALGVVMIDNISEDQLLLQIQFFL